MTAPDPYDSPLHYDLEYEDQVEDVGWYVQIARASRGPILELGCGNGRLTLPMARAGGEIHGMDRNPRMLADLARKLEEEPPEVRQRIHLREGDLRDLTGPPRFATVILPFNTIHHLHEHRDVLRVFEGIGQALLPGGVFAMDCYLPFQELYGRDPNERYGARTFTDPRDGHLIYSWEQSAYDPAQQIHNVRYIYEHSGGHTHEVHLALRVFYPRELAALIDLGGFDVIEAFSDFERRPLGADSAKWVGLLRWR